MDLSFYAFLGAVDSLVNIVRHLPANEDLTQTAATPGGTDPATMLTQKAALEALLCIKADLLKAEIAVAQADHAFRSRVEHNKDCLYRALISLQQSSAVAGKNGDHTGYISSQLHRLMEHFLALSTKMRGGEGDASTSMGSGFTGSAFYPSSSSS